MMGLRMTDALKCRRCIDYFARLMYDLGKAEKAAEHGYPSEIHSNVKAARGIYEAMKRAGCVGENPELEGEIEELTFASSKRDVERHTSKIQYMLMQAVSDVCLRS